MIHSQKDIREEDPMLRAKVEIKAKMPKCQLNILLRAIRSILYLHKEGDDRKNNEAVDHKPPLEILTRMKNINFDVEFEDMDDLIGAQIANSDSITSTTPNHIISSLFPLSPVSPAAAVPWRHIKSWISLKKAICHLLSKHLIGLPAPASATYYDLIEKLEVSVPQIILA